MTGASGFIGSNIMDSLEQRGHTVYGCCHTKIVEKDNFITCDLSKHMPDLQVDVVVHAAAVSPSGHATFILRTMLLLVKMFWNMLKSIM